LSEHPICLNDELDSLMKIGSRLFKRGTLGIAPGNSSTKAMYASATFSNTAVNFIAMSPMRGAV
jgi:hypothetical protein